MEGWRGFYRDFLIVSKHTHTPLPPVTLLALGIAEVELCLCSRLGNVPKGEAGAGVFPHTCL